MSFLSACAIGLAIAGLWGEAPAANASGSLIDLASLRNGDVILQTSTSAQAPAIIVASGSPYSHTGIISLEGAGARQRAFVLEAAGTVRKTPIDAFVRRGLGGAFTILRHDDVDSARGLAVVRAAKRLLGKPYDSAFAPGDDAVYCSELVARAFEGAGLSAGRWEPAGDLHLDNPLTKKLLQHRWRRHPSCRGLASLDACLPRLREVLVVTPASLADDPHFVVVQSTWPLIH